MKKYKIKKKKDIKVPSYLFGLFSAIGQTGEQLGETVSENGNEVLGQGISGAFNPAKAGLNYMGNSDVSTGNKLLAWTGIGSIFAANQAKKAAERRANQQRSTSLGLANTSIMQDEYWNDNDLAMTFAYGGFPNTLAYLDNNEVVRDVLGNLSKVPNNKSGVDSHLVDASGLESVLSDKIKIPNTNITFAKAGEKVMRKYKTSKGKDKYASNTNELNNRNKDLEYNSLLFMQELEKNKKGIKPKTKNIPEYAKGKTPWDDIFDDDFKVQFYNQSKPTNNYIDPTIQYGYSANGMRYNPEQIPDTDLNSVWTSTQMPVMYQNNAFTGDLTAPITSGWDNVIQNEVNSVNASLPGPITDSNIRSLGSVNNNNSGYSGSGFDFGSLAGLAPIISNTFSGLRKPEVEVPEINPYTGAINHLMSRRRYNINPAITSNARSRAISNYNASMHLPNTGASQALRTQLATDEFAQNAALYGTKQNADNAYMGEFANILNNLGQQYNSSVARTKEQNAQNRAAARNYLNTAATQFGEWAQIQQQMRNQQRTQDSLFPLYEDFLIQGHIKDKVNRVLNTYKRRRRS